MKNSTNKIIFTTVMLLGMVSGSMADSKSATSNEAAETNAALTQHKLVLNDNQNTTCIAKDNTKVDEHLRKETSVALVLLKKGNIYDKGKGGVKKDSRKAFQSYAGSARLGNADAQYILGDIYYNRAFQAMSVKNGPEINKVTAYGASLNYTKALKYYTQSAKQCNAKAQNKLGEMHDRGEGVDQDYKQAIDWYRKAADQGEAKAQYNLGEMYLYGKGISKDDKKALKLYTKSANQENSDAQYKLGSIYGQGQIFGPDYRIVLNVKQDYKKSIEWYKKSADHGNVDAQWSLGYIFENGRGVTKDTTQAVKWYTDAAKQGDIDAQFSLGYLYDINQDYQQAIEWYTKSDKHAEAQFFLGRIYYLGKGTSKDYHKAFNLFEKSAIQGHPSAQSILAFMYYMGEAVIQDDKKAVDWFRKAAKQGLAFAQEMLTELRDAKTRLKDKQIAKWSDELFDNRFFVYNFTYHEIIPNLSISQSIDVKEKSSDMIRLHGQRIIKKIWIDVEVQLNKDGTIERDNITLCTIIDKSDNLLDENIVNSNCFSFLKGKNNETLLDKVMSYFW